MQWALITYKYIYNHKHTNTYKYIHIIILVGQIPQIDIIKKKTTQTDRFSMSRSSKVLLEHSAQHDGARVTHLTMVGRGLCHSLTYISMLMYY